MPMPEVEWLKDSRPVTDNPDYKTSYEEGVCTLTIEETFTEDSALFICRAVNGAGIAETSATLTVKGMTPSLNCKDLTYCYSVVTMNFTVTKLLLEKEKITSTYSHASFLFRS